VGNQKGRGKGTSPTMPSSEKSGPPRSFAETTPPAYSRTIEEYMAHAADLAAGVADHLAVLAFAPFLVVKHWTSSSIS
jgi:hypothetical protein